MSEMLLSRDVPARPASLLQRVRGVFVAPVRTFASFQSAPRWFDALVLAVLLVSISTYVFSSSDTGARLMAERRVAFAETAGRHVTSNDYAALIVREQRGATLAAVLAGAWLVLLTLIVAGGALIIVNVLSAPSGRFSHALAIAAHAALIAGLATPIRLLLNVWRGAVGPSTSVGILLPFLPSDTIWAHLGNTIDLFGLWWAHTLAIGFAVVFLRRPDGLRLLFIGIYLVVAVALAAAKALVSAPSL